MSFDDFVDLVVNDNEMDNVDKVFENRKKVVDIFNDKFQLNSPLIIKTNEGYFI